MKQSTQTQSIQSRQGQGRFDGFELGHPHGAAAFARPGALQEGRKGLVQEEVVLDASRPQQRGHALFQTVFLDVEDQGCRAGRRRASR